MHGADGCEGQELQEVVSVRDGIQAVSIDGGEMEVLCFFERIGVIGCTRQSACSDRGHVAGFVAVFEAFEVSFEHGKVCKHVVREVDRLRTLHMGISRDDDVLVLDSGGEERALDSDELFRETADLALHVHMEIQGALVVSGSCGVQAGTGIADVVRQPLFDIHMDIFEFDGEVKLSLIDLFLDFLETRCDFFLIFSGDDAVSSQHFRMGDRSGDIFPVHPAVVGNGGVEIQRILFLGFREAASPHHFTHFSFFSFIRALMVSGSPKRLMKPSASAWL